MNILLLSMSTFSYLENTEEEKNKPRRLRRSFFSYKGDNIEISNQEYYSQLEPITRILIETGNKPDEVIALCTQAAVKPVKYRLGNDKEDMKSPLDFYINRIIYIADKNRSIEYKKFPQGKDAYLNPNDIASKNSAIAEIALYLLSKKNSLKNNEDLHLWIDTQGGMRDVSLLMNAIVSLLKTSDIKIEDIYSINYTDGTGNVIKQNDAYHIFDFVSGMNEFVQYGRADQLVNYYSEGNKTKTPALINQMKELADSIMLCDLNRFYAGLEEIKKTLDILEKNNESNDVLLNIFVEQIKEDYKEILKKDASGVDKIKWFHKKKLYQQTLTYIESNGPKDWERSGVLSLLCIEYKGSTPPSLTNMVNNYIGYIIDGIYENMNESHAEAFKNLLKEGPAGQKYWRKNKDNKKRDLLKECIVVRKNKKEPVNENNWAYKYKVESRKKGNNYNQLYRLIALYKLIKMERNLFNHMDNQNNDNESKNKRRMKIDELDALINSYVETCENLCSKENV